MAQLAIRIIGIDPGLRRTGWGIIEQCGSRLSHIAHGTLKVDDKASLAERLLDLHGQLTAIIREWQPHEAAVEETFVNKDARATLKLGHARAVALLVPASAGIAVSEYAPNAVKKAIVGAGHAEKTQVHEMVQLLLARCRVTGADAADALAVAITHAHHRSAYGARRLAGASV
ncbi:crossover junction endodeoxyribonuclease RuvC [Rhodoligotrophos defluvii]|uniref:crossover junction endodeoxyribonuclease RuvC n=1 Tax=Rhodoligotrophos defluvii TaxID=2561934 RepID=UPI0010C9891C|nr:crossover junction endodeoxyribonuclease RuvC [Rhodoligotrophos defluvii]